MQFRRRISSHLCRQMGTPPPTLTSLLVARVTTPCVPLIIQFSILRTYIISMIPFFFLGITFFSVLLWKQILGPSWGLTVDQVIFLLSVWIMIYLRKEKKRRGRSSRRRKRKRIVFDSKKEENRKRYQEDTKEREKSQRTNKDWIR